MVAIIVAFAPHDLLNRSFSTIDCKRSLRIPISDTERIYLFLSVFLINLTSMV